MTSTYFIGLEGIAERHTIAVLSNQEGELLAAIRFGTGISYHTMPRHELRATIARILSDLASRIGKSLSDFVGARLCIGLTGVTFRYESDFDLPNEIAKLNLRLQSLTCTGDVEIAFASHTLADRGSAIICHLGSTAYVADQPLRKRFGGWGPAIGDEGSAFSMGRATLRQLGRDFDSGKPPGKLWFAVKRWLENPTNPPTSSLEPWADAALDWQEKVLALRRAKIDTDPRTILFSFCHHFAIAHGVQQWRSVASSFTVPLMWAWEAEDPAAGIIVEAAAANLTDQLFDAAESARFDIQSGPIVLYGGVFLHNPRFVALVQRRIHERGLRVISDSFNCKIITIGDPGTMRPACGALVFALGDSHPGHLRLPAKAILDTISNQHAEWEALRND